MDNMKVNGDYIYYMWHEICPETFEIGHVGVFVMFILSINYY